MSDDNIVSLDQFKKDNEPHCSGVAKCIGCKHTWVAIAPVGTFHLECPNCETFKGVFDGLAMPQLRYECSCGCDLFFITPSEVVCSLCAMVKT